MIMIPVSLEVSALSGILLTAPGLLQIAQEERSKAMKL
jgi:hypothetical protein